MISFIYLEGPIGLTGQLEHVGGGVEALGDGLPCLRGPGVPRGAAVLDVAVGAYTYMTSTLRREGGLPTYRRRK